MNRWLSGLALVAIVAGMSAMAFEPGKVESIAPAVPGGGWD